MTEIPERHLSATRCTHSLLTVTIPSYYKISFLTDSLPRIPDPYDEGNSILETSGKSEATTQHNIPEDLYPQLHCCENLQYHI
jgi:hypothetical protein